MRDAIAHLNYIHVLVVTIAGFILGCLWSHGPIFGHVWMREMKLTKDSMEARMREQGMGLFLIKGLSFTLLSTFGLAVLLAIHGSHDWQHGAIFGGFVGLLGPGVRMAYAAAWENPSPKLQAINLSHEIAIYTLQGAILGAWH
ncbi:MAG TPA: DUF1761 domain-containing protein [Candidatus Didemnitutus sp.]|nr:DUF1761 domain-containing protein [Candidatus Didemnitutus sp.]